MAKRPKTENRGGPRENSGKRSYFRGKSGGTAGGGQVNVWLTDTGLAAANAGVERLNRERPEGSIEVSRSVLAEALFRKYGPTIKFSELARLADVEWRRKS